MANKEALKATLLFKAQDSYSNNSIFFIDEIVGRKSDFIKYKLLKDRLALLNIDLSTPDINNPSEADLIINIDHVLFNYKLQKKIKPIEYLILTEIPSANIDSWLIHNHVRFNKVFTYNLDIVDDRKYFYLPYTVDITIKKQQDVNVDEMFEKRNFLIMVANPANHQGQNLIYHKREDVLNWYNKNHDNMLSVYGTRWRDFYRNALLKKMGWIKNICPNFFKEYLLNSYLSKTKKVFKGTIPKDKKKDTLEQYKFSVCFENEEGPTGNITEKIFDCFEALTIPIYLGPTNISDFIPEACYINFRKFTTIEQMHNYIYNMDKNTYTNYVISIMDFLHSEKFEKFKHNFFLDTIQKHAEADLTLK